MEPLRTYEEAVDYVLKSDISERGKQELLKLFKIKHEEEVVSEKVRQRHKNSYDRCIRYENI